MRQDVLVVVNFAHHLRLYESNSQKLCKCSDCITKAPKITFTRTYGLNILRIRIAVELHCSSRVSYAVWTDINRPE